MIKKAQEIEAITQCKVSLKLYPTWKKGKVKSYVSAGLDLEDDSYNSSTIASNTQAFNEGLDEHVTPTKARATSTPGPSCDTVTRKRVAIDPNICQICKVEYVSDADIDSHWVQCAKNCNYWVHATCCGIYYKNDSSGEKNLGKWSEKHFFCKRHMPHD